MKTAKIKLIICMVLLVLLASLASAATKYINTLDGINQSIGNNNLIFIDNSNSMVGIGTLTPTVKLDVAGTVNATQFTINGSDLYSLFAELSDKIGNTTAEIWNVVDNETFARLTGFSGENITSGSVADARVVDDLTIVSSKTINTTGGLNVSGGAYIKGNVGIGTLTPNEKLTVVGNVNITENLTISGKITGSHKQELEVESIGDVEAGKGMVLLMRFNNDSVVGESYDDSGAANSTVYDYSDTENNGTFYYNGTNAVGYKPNGGIFGGAFEFDGVDDYVKGNASDNLDGGGSPKTVEAWIYQKNAAQARVVGVFQSQGNTLPQYSLMVSNTQLLRVQLCNNSGYFANGHMSTSPYSLNAWHHVAFTYDNTDLKIYVDGRLDISYNLLDQIVSNSSPYFYIGTRGDVGGNEFFNGTIDEVAIYNRSLSADEILEHYKKGFKNVVEGSTVFSDETRVKDNLIVQGNLSVTAINPSGGSVGIGMESPNTLLHLYTTAVGPHLTIEKSGSYGGQMALKFSGANVSTGTHLGSVDWYGQVFDTNTMMARVAANAQDANTQSSYLSFSTANEGNPTEVMRIDKSGNVGIGTTSPEGKLDVASEFVVQPTTAEWTSGSSNIKNITMGPGDVYLITASYNPNNVGSSSYRKQITKLVGFHVGYTSGPEVNGYLNTNTLFDSSDGGSQAQGDGLGDATLTITFPDGSTSGGATSATTVYVNLTTGITGAYRDITIVKMHDAS